MKSGKVEKFNGIVIPTEMKYFKIRIIYWTIFAILSVIAVICVFPTLWVLLSAFKNTEEFLMTPPTIIPRSFEIGKLFSVWHKLPGMGRAYINTLIMGLGDIAFSITVNGLAGYVLSRLKPKGHKLIFTLVLWTMLMPSSVSMVPLFMTFVDFPYLHVNMTNTFLPMWLMAGANPFYILLFKSFFDSIPMSYLEAARIDGCREISIFMRIIVPLSTPIMMTVVIFIMNAIWGSFLWPYLILREPSLYTTGIKIYSMVSEVTMDEYYMAMIFVTIPPVVVYLIFQKNLMKGVSLGGIKG